MAGVPFTDGQISLDYSLQLGFGIQSFYISSGKNGAGVLKPDGTPMEEVNRAGETSQDFFDLVQEAIKRINPTDTSENP